MTKLTRRDFLAASASVAAASTVATTSAFAAPAAPAARGAGLKFEIETGATLRVLRWKRFVQGDEDRWNANVKKFTEKTGVAVRTDSEGWEDLRQKAAVAANVGSGPDIVMSWFDDPQQYPTKLMDLTDRRLHWAAGWAAGMTFAANTAPKTASGSHCRSAW